MTTFALQETILIEADPALVRSQFADVGHHQRTAPHKGVRFEVLDLDERRCRYLQTSSVGPLRLGQEVELAVSTSGPLVNRITKGQFAGGMISFIITSHGDVERQPWSMVTARLEAPLRGPRRLLVPLLRFQVGKALRRALSEDKTDIESGSYSESVAKPTAPEPS